MRATLGLVFGSLCVFALPAFGGTFHYRVDHFPANGDCHQIAAEIGEKFQRLTAIEPTSALCSDIAADGFSFDVTYTADDRLDAVSTLKDFNLGQEGAFPTLAACEAVKATETEHFQTVTGLEPIVAYCREFSLGSAVSYDLRIDSFGNPAMRPFVIDTLIFDRPVDVTIPAFEQMIKDSLAARAIDVRYATLLSNGTYAMLSTLYYGTEEYDLSSPELAAVDSKSQCLEQLGFAQASAQTRSEPPVALYCAQSMISTYYVIGIYLQDTADQLSAERFNSYAQCQGQRGALIDAYNQRLGGRVTAGLCTKDENLVWRVRMLLR